MLRLLCLGGACLALALGAGCGDEDEDPGAGSAGVTQDAPAETQAETTEAQTETEEASGGEEITVRMKDFAFDPKDVEAKVGQKITWVNEDDAPHNAVAQNGGDLKTETFEKDGSDSYTAGEPGTIEYICTVHPEMTGTITVTE